MWHRKLSNQLHQTVLTINRRDNNICHVLQFCFFSFWISSILLLAKPKMFESFRFGCDKNTFIESKHENKVIILSPMSSLGLVSIINDSHNLITDLKNVSPVASLTQQYCRLGLVQDSSWGFKLWCVKYLREGIWDFQWELRDKTDQSQLEMILQ